MNEKKGKKVSDEENQEENFFSFFKKKEKGKMNFFYTYFINHSEGNLKRRYREKRAMIKFKQLHSFY
ncbi:hypothetical protein Avbf_07894 [Armadillidium vulgare]|nr:hypothetical protein Avbf_07894 [Armadillidium vulgare]